MNRHFLDKPDIGLSNLVNRNFDVNDLLKLYPTPGLIGIRLKELARISHEHCVVFQNIFVFSRGSTLFQSFFKSTQCSPKVSPCGAIFVSILPVNIAYYGSLPKTLKLTPPELMKNPG
jgi:hypothetical protein